MIKVSALEFQRQFGRYHDLARREPVLVTRHGRDTVVLLSTEEYARLRRRDREALAVEELSDEDLAAIARAEMPKGHEQLDAELAE